VGKRGKNEKKTTGMNNSVENEIGGTTESGPKSDGSDCPKRLGSMSVETLQVSPIIIQEAKNAVDEKKRPPES